jgi:nitrite reductase/ring-hydroxylating ferredoxin subunit
MFFKKHTQWYKVFGSTEEAENNAPLNKPITVEVGNFIVCMVRTDAGYFAVDDKCPHQGASLSKGHCNIQNNSIVCPWHKYAFSLENGRYFGANGDAVKTFPVQVRPDGLFIGIETTKFALF